MSQANVEIAKRFNALGASGEIDAVLELVANDVVATNLAGPLDEPQVFRAARPWSHIGRSTPRCSTTSTARWRSGSTRATG